MASRALRRAAGIGLLLVAGLGLTAPSAGASTFRATGPSGGFAIRVAG